MSNSQAIIEVLSVNNGRGKEEEEGEEREGERETLSHFFLAPPFLELSRDNSKCSASFM